MAVKLTVFVLIYLKGTLVFAANNLENAQANETFANNLNITQIPDGSTGDKLDRYEVPDAKVTNIRNNTSNKETLTTETKPSDEIIISGLDYAKTEHLKPTTSSGGTGQAKVVHEKTTLTTTQHVKNDSLINLRDSDKTTTSNTNLSTNIASTTVILQDNLDVVKSSADKTTTEKSSAVTSKITPELSTHPSNVNISDSPHNIPNEHPDFETHKTVHHNIIYKHHHIPFRHHLQLVPMDDEPFGSVLLKDQRYIISVLIPIGVGIVGALVIMVTVYGLRHVAKKHGREFPRVDIEAGRQNIASISSERTDKMLLLDDDEDNEF